MTDKTIKFSLIITLVLLVSISFYLVVNNTYKTTSDFVKIEVKNGDNLWNYYSQYGEYHNYSFYNFMSWVNEYNKINSDKLKAGDVIYIPIKTSSIESDVKFIASAN
ncbi:MAG: hypothetical protein K0S34_693 [Bacillales bacterium]|jgi:hypothetical protein|nr:hypothetical protein [Bacillales bacterium]